MVKKAALLAWLSWTLASAQSLGGAGTLRGTVRDASDAVVPSATVVLSNPLTGFSRETKSGADGVFTINGIPPSNYQLLVSVAGFRPGTMAVTIRTGIPMDVSIHLEVAGQQSSVVVEAAPDNLVENKATPSDTVDQKLLAVLPMTSPGSGLNDAIIYTTPGVAADSNGFFHPLGDHAQVSYVIDGQPVSDQRNKVFSTSIPNQVRHSVVTQPPPIKFA